MWHSVITEGLFQLFITISNYSCGRTWDRKIMRCPSSGKKFKVRTLKIALEIESLVHEYIEYPLYYIIVHGYYHIQCRTYCKVMTQ